MDHNTNQNEACKIKKIYERKKIWLSVVCSRILRGNIKYSRVNLKFNGNWSNFDNQCKSHKLE